jgi:hypothetical protein
MKRSRFTKEQIIAILREQEAGLRTALIRPPNHQIETPYTRRRALSASTFQKFRSLEVSSCVAFLNKVSVARLKARGAK